MSDLGRRMHALITELYPICRSISGEGLRETLRILARYAPLELHEVPTGTEILDWTVPNEWNIRDAYVADARGARVIDFRRSNLHVVGYSAPFRGRLTLDELLPHLHSLPEKPKAIPYRTTYFEETWGFCLSHEDLLGLRPGTYDVCVDTTLEPGSITYGEAVLSGEEDSEVVLAVHACHPSMCNDNLSGMAVAAFIAQELAHRRRRHTFRFLFHPGTIGAIAWLARNRDRLDRFHHGLVLTCVGDPGGITYKHSRQGTAAIDRAATHVLAFTQKPHELQDFVPWGYAERQFCSPGFNLPVGCLMRSPHGSFPEYHTSADDLSFVTPGALAESYSTALAILEVLEGNRTYVNARPYGEPHLARAGLDADIAEHPDPAAFRLALLWVLNLSDGETSLLDIATRSGLPFEEVQAAAARLVDRALLVGGH